MAVKLGRIIDVIIEVCQLKLSKLQGKGWAGGVEREVSQALKLLGYPPKVCIDVGGNQGRYSEELLKRSSHLQLTIFEPESNNAIILNEKFGLMENVIVEPIAVCDQTGEASLFSDQQSSPLASLTKRNLAHLGIAFDEVEIVRTIRFEDY